MLGGGGGVRRVLKVGFCCFFVVIRWVWGGVLCGDFEFFWVVGSWCFLGSLRGLGLLWG